MPRIKKYRRRAALVLFLAGFDVKEVGWLLGLRARDVEQIVRDANNGRG
jgi:hypothetical protein